ncbi:MAG: IS607 family transposase [Firmicutes bacterium]|nr:IS607 family transposase [Bacillota bacterium]
MERTLTSHEVAQLLGVNIKTVQRWDREGRLKAAGRTATGRRYYTEDQILAFRHQQPAPTGPRKIVAYCRVSSQSQRPDLKNQRLALEQFCTARGLANVEFIEEVGGGLNFHRKKFLALMDAVDAGEIQTLIVAHPDRLTRFGYEWFERFCQQHGCEILALNQEHWSPEQELVQDLLTITQVFSARLSGLRNYRKRLKEALDADVSAPDSVRSHAGSDPVR